MASRHSTSFSLRSNAPTKDALTRENRYLRGRLGEVEEELRQAKIRLGENRVWKMEEEEYQARVLLNSLRMPSPEEERFPRETAKSGIGEMVAQVVDGGKRRKVEGELDPEKEVGNSLPRMVKVGGVRWEDGIGGVEVALREAEVECCEGTRWLVGKGELKKRRERGSLASTVVVRVREDKMEHQLKRSGLWVGGYWCSVKRFVAVQLRGREAGWMRVMDGIQGKVDMLSDKLAEEALRGRGERSKELGKQKRSREGEELKAELKGVKEGMKKLEGMVCGLGRQLVRNRGSERERKEVVQLERVEKEEMRKEEEEMEVEFEKEEKKRSRLSKGKFSSLSGGTSVFSPGVKWEPKPGLFG